MFSLTVGGLPSSRFWQFLFEQGILRMFPNLKQPRLLLAAIDPSKNLVDTIPQKLWQLCIDNVQIELLDWLKALAVSLSDFPVLKTLTLDASEWWEVTDVGVYDLAEEADYGN